MYVKIMNIAVWKRQRKSIKTYSQGKESIKISLVIYAELESLLKIINTCHNSPGKSSTPKK